MQKFLTYNDIPKLLSYASTHQWWDSIDHQLGRKDNTKTELLSTITLNNLVSSELFINKAIGWSLRDYSKTNPDWVRNFIQRHKEKLAPLSIREASKYL